MSRILEAMKVDQAMRIVHATQIVRKRKLACEEIVRSVFGYVTHSRPWESLPQAEAFLEFVAPPISIWRQLRDRHDHHHMVGEFMDFDMSPYVEENEVVSERRSLDQELLVITPSTWQLNLQAKARFDVVVGNANPSAVEGAIQRSFDKEKILKPDLVSRIRTVTPRHMLRFFGRNLLSNSRKVDPFAWLEKTWERIESL
jgi:hypothetical protein